MLQDRENIRALRWGWGLSSSRHHLSQGGSCWHKHFREYSADGGKRIALALLTLITLTELCCPQESNV
jgi:hypothetical protein